MYQNCVLKVYFQGVSNFSVKYMSQKPEKIEINKILQQWSCFDNIMDKSILIQVNGKFVNPIGTA